LFLIFLQVSVTLPDFTFAPSFVREATTMAKQKRPPTQRLLH